MSHFLRKPTVDSYHILDHQAAFVVMPVKYQDEGVS
jgi:hypothetical protein